MYASSSISGGYSVKVTNTGDVPGGFKLLGFVTCGNDVVGFPLQRLFGFVGVAKIVNHKLNIPQFRGFKMAPTIVI